jgi:hypothetical protein
MRSQERKGDLLGVAPGDDCHSKQQGVRPPQSKAHRHHSTPCEYKRPLGRRGAARAGGDALRGCRGLSPKPAAQNRDPLQNIEIDNR